MSILLEVGISNGEICNYDSKEQPWLEATRERIVSANASYGKYRSPLPGIWFC